MNQIDQILHQAARTEAVPGVVAVAVNAGQVIYEGAFGRRVLPDGPPMTLDTVFRIASMTKAVTAVAAMQLVEQGRLSLDAPAANVLSELASRQVLEGFDSTGRPILRPARSPITLRQLLTHTAGFGYDTWNADLQRYYREAGLPAVRTGLLAALDAPLTFEPGTRWQYGINIDWVGRMIEAVSGEDLEAYFQRHIFAPLGMASTSYLVRPDMEPRLATVHARTDQGLQPLQLDSRPPREFYPGGGGLYSTAGDYLTFLRMLLSHGTAGERVVLQKHTVATMLQNHIGKLSVEPMQSAVPTSSNDVELFPGIPKKWGLSFLINTEPVPNGRAANSVAWAGLYNTYYWLDPSRKVAGVLMAQVLPFADGAVLDLLARFEDRIYGTI
ncbi:MAG TPA: serine hydrolase domain-containing protein [Acetobacteraceae bacterium]